MHADRCTGTRDRTVEGGLDRNRRPFRHGQMEAPRLHGTRDAVAGAACEPVLAGLVETQRRGRGHAGFPGWCMKHTYGPAWHRDKLLHESPLRIGRSRDGCHRQYLYPGQWQTGDEMADFEHGRYRTGFR